MPPRNNDNNKPSAPVIRRRIPKSQRRRDGLIQYAKDVTSQNGEDGIIHKIFNEILPAPVNVEQEQRQRRYCVDVGAWDGKHLSNTYSLLVAEAEGQHHPQQQQSWRGILIEADPNRFQELKRLHDPLGNICVNETVSSDPESKNSLVSILRREACVATNDDDEGQIHLPNDFDFLCIDVDGSDYWLLHDVFEHNYRPKVVCIESNPTMPNDLIYIPARDDTRRHGCSLAALVELAEVNDYMLVETTLYNAFFVPRNLYQAHFKEHVPENSIEALHETTMGTELYQLYDGTLKLWGCKKLLWHRIAMDETRMQIISSSQRNFPFAPNNKNNKSNRNAASEAAIQDSVIDMGVYCCQTPVTASSESTNDNGRNHCAASLLARLQSDGFALVKNTGIRGELCRDALRVTHSFLQEADENVRRSCLSKKDRARRGYSPINTENFASLLGEEGPNDLVRKFRIGPPSPEEYKVDFASPASSSLLQANAWPSPSISEEWDEVVCNDFRSTLEEYYDKVCTAANRILEAICDGLLSEHPDLAVHLEPLLLSPPSSTGTTSDDTVREKKSLAHNTSILTLLGYRIGSRHKKIQQKKKKMVYPLVAAHTDVGVITVLLYDGGDCAALQRQSKQSSVGSNDSDEARFQDVLLPSRIEDDPVFVVNIADCLSALTNKRLPSTVHRVVPREGAFPRNCLALFVGLKAEEKLVIDGHEMSYEVWRKNRVAESQKVLKSSGSIN